MKKKNTFRLGYLMCMTGSLKRSEGKRARRKQAPGRRRSAFSTIKSAGLEKN